MFLAKQRMLARKQKQIKDTETEGEEEYGVEELKDISSSQGMEFDELIGIVN